MLWDKAICFIGVDTKAPLRSFSLSGYDTTRMTLHSFMRDSRTGTEKVGVPMKTTFKSFILHLPLFIWG